MPHVADLAMIKQDLSQKLSQTLSNATLLLIDVQQDFLARSGLLPAKNEFLAQLHTLLTEWRSCQSPIFHIRTQIQAGGSDRMPHWVKQDIWSCVAGSSGYEPPIGFAAQVDEKVFHKRFFSAFDNLELLPALQQNESKTLVIAGLYTHACVQATVLDAYQHGFDVIVVTDAIASTEPQHAAFSQAWMNGRAATFIPMTTLLTAKKMTIATVASSVATVCAKTATAGKIWAKTPVTQRAAVLERWADQLEQDTTTLTTLLANEIGKPINEARDELRRTLAHIRLAAKLALEALESDVLPNITIRWCPVGTIGLITPWNNPFAIAAGKLAPALAFGNSCVWKPSPHAPKCSATLYQSLLDAGLPDDVVKLVIGDAVITQSIVTNQHIDAVSVTGSNATGQAIANLCHLHQKPLQAELGGNNAVLILDDWEFNNTDMVALAQSVFGFAGQRCTAIRRLIVQKGIVKRFTTAFAEVVQDLQVGDPLDPQTQVGRLISVKHRQQVQAHLNKAIGAGASILAQAELPIECDSQWDGYWLAPTLLNNVTPDSTIACEETFGPIAVIMEANDLEHAITIANSVPQGLVAMLYSNNVAAKKHFMAHMEAGMLKLSSGALPISAEAPFCGWKHSAIGPPEHGIWDRDFYTKVQAVYT